MKPCRCHRDKVWLRRLNRRKRAQYRALGLPPNLFTLRRAIYIEQRAFEQMLEDILEQPKGAF